MSDEKETLLSAFLDDELPLEERRSAEALLADDPAKAEELRSLTAVRDLVAGLPRPAAPDLSAAVLERISRQAAHTTHSGLRSFGAFARRAATAATAAAAMLLLGFQLAGRRGEDRSPPDPAFERPAQPPAIVEATREATGEFVGPPDSLAGIAAKAVAAPAPVAATDVGTFTAGELRDRPGPYKIFIVSGLDGSADREEAAALLEISSHRDFYRFDVPEATRTAASTVFAAELDSSELATLRTRLGTAFSDRLEEGEASTSLLSDLAQAGRATTLRANPAADVHFPQNAMALRSPALAPSRDDAAPEAVPSPVPSEEGAASLVDGPASAAPPGTDRGRSVVLIWIQGPASE